MKNILRFDIDDENWKLTRKDLIGAMFDIIFSGGIPKGDEGPIEPEVIALLSQPDITYKTYIKKAGFSSDSFAYNTPWYTYDKRFGRSAAYRDFVWEIKKVFGMKIAYIFFTEKFTKVIKPTPQNLSSIEKVFFDTGYLQFT